MEFSFDERLLDTVLSLLSEAGASSVLIDAVRRAVPSVISPDPQDAEAFEEGWQILVTLDAEINAQRDGERKSRISSLVMYRLGWMNTVADTTLPLLEARQ
jgi:hypothetical protein